LIGGAPSEVWVSLPVSIIVINDVDIVTIVVLPVSHFVKVVVRVKVKVQEVRHLVFASPVYRTENIHRTKLD
jgi:hypothetical protein